MAFTVPSFRLSPSWNTPHQDGSATTVRTRIAIPYLNAKGSQIYILPGMAGRFGICFNEGLEWLWRTLLGSGYLQLRCSLLGCPRLKGNAESTNFVPPRILSATGISYPQDIAASRSGRQLSVIDLDVSGTVSCVHTVRHVPAVTGPALTAIDSWTFSPAYLEGKAVASNISLNILFNPGAAPASRVPLEPADWSWQARQPDYVPPRVSSAFYAVYPDGAVPGTVVLDVRVDKNGSINGAAAIRDIPSLTQSVTTAIGKWNFAPGAIGGEPIAAHTVVAFVFQAPEIP